MSEQIVALTHLGFISKMDTRRLRPQQRGGQGRTLRSNGTVDTVVDAVVAGLDDDLLAFASDGRCWSIPVRPLPGRTSHRLLADIIRTKYKTDPITAQFVALVPIRPEDHNSMQPTVLVGTGRGLIKRLPLTMLFPPEGSLAEKYMTEGIIDLSPSKGSDLELDSVRSATLVRSTSATVFLASDQGRIGRIKAHTIPIAKRLGDRGVKGLKEATITAMWAGLVAHSDRVTILLDNGYIKKVPQASFRAHQRDRKGVRVIPRWVLRPWLGEQPIPCHNRAVGIGILTPLDDAVVVSFEGHAIRFYEDQIPSHKGRTTMGARAIDTGPPSIQVRPDWPMPRAVALLSIRTDRPITGKLVTPPIPKPPPNRKTYEEEKRETAFQKIRSLFKRLL